LQTFLPPVALYETALYETALRETAARAILIAWSGMRAENRFPPRIKSGAGFFLIPLYTAEMLRGVVMRIWLCLVATFAGAGIALAQTAPTPPKKPAPPAAPAPAKPTAKPAGKPAAKPAPKPKPAVKPAPKPAADSSVLKETYAAMPLAERLAIQSDLVWSGDYNGIIDGDFGERAIAAVKAFQKRNKGKDSGLLTAEERAVLASAVRAQQQQVGWRLVEDDVTPGLRLGIPAKLVVKSERGASGTRWFSTRGEVQIETFREKMAGAQLSELFEEQKKAHNRKVEYNVMRPDAFVLSGLQGLKRFYVRVQLKDNEARGLTILHDQAMDGIMQPVVVAMSSAFAPFASASATARRKPVDYASGVIVGAAGHILTARRTSEDCAVIVVPRYGNAERIAEDATSGLALLRVNGAAARPLPLSTEPPKGAELLLIGIADPQAQAGGHAVSSAPAKLRGVEGARVLLDAAPPPGFSGAAALDTQGGFVGMVDVNADTASAQPALVPAATIRKFLASHVTVTNGRSNAESAKAAVVRVICVRT
jgi:hypothetical protein